MKRMRFAHRWLLLFSLATVCSLKLVAQEVQPRPASDFYDRNQGLNEGELVTRAVAANPMLEAQRQQIEVAKGDVTEALLQRNPSITVSGLKEVNGDDHGISVTGSVPLEL